MSNGASRGGATGFLATMAPSWHGRVLSRASKCWPPARDTERILRPSRPRPTLRRRRPCATVWQRPCGQTGRGDRACRKGRRARRSPRLAAGLRHRRDGLGAVSEPDVDAGMLAVANRELCRERPRCAPDLIGARHHPQHIGRRGACRALADHDIAGLNRVINGHQKSFDGVRLASALPRRPRGMAIGHDPRGTPRDRQANVAELMSDTRPEREPAAWPVSICSRRSAHGWQRTAKGIARSR